MARRRSRPAPARGGEVVQAPRPDPARLILSSGSAACAGCLAAYAATRTGTWAGLSGGIGGAAAAGLAAAGLLRRRAPVGWALFVLAALYAATLRGDALDGWSVAYGAGLLLAAELAYGAAGHEPLVRAERAVVARQAAAVAGLVAASLAAGLVVVAVAGLRVGAGLPLAAAGAAAAVALLLLYARLARA